MNNPSRSAFGAPPRGGVASGPAKPVPRRPLGLVPLFAGFALAGCQVLNAPPPVDVAEPTSALPVAQPAPAVNNGAIFQAAQYRPLFEDHRARLVGDTITVQIVEKVSASQKSTSSIDKSGEVSAAVTALPFFNPNSFNRASAAGNSSNTFTGKGSTENSNNFSGTITATVTGVLPNGHLLIAGEKQIGVNHNVDVLRFSGQVDPRAIQPGNVVPSAQIANVRIEHRGRGAQAEAQGIGWLARFFLNVLPI
jgi:flagellar L-ring protein precursor FlgH